MNSCKPTTADAYRLFHEGVVALTEMEANGLRIDTDYLEQAVRDTEVKVRELEAELRMSEEWTAWRKRWADKAKLGSRTQLAEVLFNVLKHPSPGFTEKSLEEDYDGEKRYSTRKIALEQMGLPFVQKYIRWESLQKKVIGTYLKGIQRETCEGRLRPSINLNTAQTYRSSYSDPNLQAMPIRDPEQGEIIRKAFIADDGCALVENDFGALEFCIAACVVGGTLIETIDGPRTIEDVSRTVESGAAVHVYGYDQVRERICVRRVLEGGLTRRRAEVWEVVLDNGKRVVATPDHKFMRRDGTYVELKKLKTGDSLMPFYKKTKKSAWGTCYTDIYLNNGERMLAHNLIAEDVMGVRIAGSSKIVHHWDGNGTNNSLTNIEVMSRRRHMQIHSVQGWKRHPGRRRDLAARNRTKEARERTSRMNAERKRTWSVKDWEEWKQRLREGIKRNGGHAGERNGMHGRQHSEESRAKMAERKKGYVPLTAGWNRGHTADTHPSVRKISEANTGKPAWNRGMKLSPLSAEQRLKMSRALKGRKLTPEHIRKVAIGRKRAWAAKPDETCALCGKTYRIVSYSHLRKEHDLSLAEYRETYNHRVVSVRRVGRSDVYNITVEGVHNYALEAGIIIKNCKWRDPKMIAYASDPKLDIHRDMAAKCFLCEPGQVTKQARQLIKAGFVFAHLYGSYHKNMAPYIYGNAKDITVEGMSVFKWMKKKGVRELGDCNPKERAQPRTFEYHMKEVEEWFDDYFDVFKSGREEWFRSYDARGWFRLMTGFLCQGLYSRNMLLNYDVQGPGFHCLLWTIIRLRQHIRKRKMKTRLIGQIHDCALASVPKRELQDYLHLIRHVVSVELPKAWDWIVVPLKIEAEVSFTTWFDKKVWVDQGGVWGPKEAKAA
jgi:hypothetical protein